MSHWTSGEPMLRTVDFRPIPIPFKPVYVNATHLPGHHFLHWELHGLGVSRANTYMNQMPNEGQEVLGYVEPEKRWAVVKFMPAPDLNPRRPGGVLSFRSYNTPKIDRRYTRGWDDNLRDWGWREGIHVHPGQDVRDWMALPTRWNHMTLKKSRIDSHGQEIPGW